MPRTTRIALGLETPKKSRKARTSSFGEDYNSSDDNDGAADTDQAETPARSLTGFSENVPTPIPESHATKIAQHSAIPMMPPVPGSPMPSTGKLVELENGKRVSIATSLLKAGKPGSLSDRLVPVPFSPMRLTHSQSELAVGSVASGNTNSSARGSMSLLLSPLKKVQGQKSREEMLLTAAGKEVEQLASALDTAHREREMQKREIARLRAMLAKQALDSAPAGKTDGSGTPGYISFVPSKVEHVFQDDSLSGDEGEREDEDEEGDDEGDDEGDGADEGDGDGDGHEPRFSESRGVRNLTTADKTGRPSEQDMLDLSLGPVGSTNASRVGTRNGLR